MYNLIKWHLLANFNTLRQIMRFLGIFLKMNKNVKTIYLVCIRSHPKICALFTDHKIFIYQRLIDFGVFLISYWKL
jgi:hypothetical protein